MSAQTLGATPDDNETTLAFMQLCFWQIVAEYVNIKALYAFKYSHAPWHVVAKCSVIDCMSHKGLCWQAGINESSGLMCTHV